MRLLLNSLAASFLLITSAASFADAGRVQSIDGVVFINRIGAKPIIAAKGASLESGDEIETGSGSAIVMKMADGQEIFLKEKTRFRIDYFKYDADKPADSQSVMNLVKGGLRAVSGLIGHLGDPDAYKLLTAKATVGIRGTEYSVVLCEQDCASGKDGLNVYVIDGKIILVNEAGTFGLSAGEGALVGDIRSKMTPLPSSEVQKISVPKTFGGRDCGV